MPNVRSVQDRSKGALLILDDGVKVWTPDKELARTLLGKPIPPDWTRRENENGPMALPPKPRGAGGMTAWRNTKEGFEAEAAGRRRWQEIEEEKKDRRTALMQAVAIADDDDPGSIIVIAELMYDWLRESSPAAGPAAQPAGVATTEERPRTPPQAGAPTSVAAGIPQSPGLDPGDASVTDGEAVPKQGSGEGSIKTSPGSTKYSYSLDPAKCSHKFPSGRWLKWDAEDRCPRCGTPKISAVEGTTADLGSA